MNIEYKFLLRMIVPKLENILLFSTKTF